MVIKSTIVRLAKRTVRMVAQKSIEYFIPENFHGRRLNIRITFLWYDAVKIGSPQCGMFSKNMYLFVFCLDKEISVTIEVAK